MKTLSTTRMARCPSWLWNQASPTKYSAPLVAAKRSAAPKITGKAPLERLLNNVRYDARMMTSQRSEIRLGRCSDSDLCFTIAKSRRLYKTRSERPKLLGWLRVPASFALRLFYACVRYVVMKYISQMLSRELKKGSAELLVLSLVEDRARHGYEIGKLI